MEDFIVKVQQGKLRGINEKNVNGMNFVAFRGVPYAKPPVGNLRFKDSEPMVPWFGVKNATKFSSPCAQQDGTTPEIMGSDDCLYLNIYTPMLHPITPKAVMVWIHGGSFICGSGDDFLYGPDYLIEKDIILVTINYRVGILGFLNIEDEEAPGNQGLKDQVLALKWIQQNISQFGGDPKNVTIFGNSAGSASVHYLTISPMAEGLFHKAILQSGVATGPWTHLPTSSIEPVKKLAEELNKDTTDMKEFVNYLRTLNAHDLVKAATKIQTREEGILYAYPFIPSVDRNAKTPFLTQPVEEAAKVGIKVPCICGYVSHDGLAIFSGTCHGDELSFLFHAKLGEVENRQPPAPNSTEHCLIQRFTEMWTNFAKIGNPTPRVSDLIPIVWEPIEPSIFKKEYKYLNITDELTTAKEKNITQLLIDSKKLY